MMNRAPLVVVLVIGAMFEVGARYGASDVSIVRNDAARRVDVLVGGKPFTSYIYPATIKKPVLYPLRAANGTIVTRGFPLEPRPRERTDHPHQVGAWFTYGDVNGIDFWGYSDETPANEVPTKGTIVHRAITRTVDGAGRGELEATADWVMPDGSVILAEQTRFVFHARGDWRAIDRITRWTARDKRVVFGDTPITIAILDHPGNPGYPTYWHARGYGLFAANPLGSADFTGSKARNDTTLEAGDTLTFQYRIVIVSGKASPERIESEYQQFVR